MYKFSLKKIFLILNQKELRLRVNLIYVMSTDVHACAHTPVMRDFSV